MHQLRGLNHLMPHGDWFGAGLGIQISDEESGELTLAFSMLDISEKSLEGEFDSRCPICATKENTIDVIRKNMEAEGFPSIPRNWNRRTMCRQIPTS